MDIKPEDLRIETFAPKASAWVPRAETSVRLTHMPTGVTVEYGEHRSVHANKAAAMDKLVEALEDFYGEESEGTEYVLMEKHWLQNIWYAAETLRNASNVVDRAMGDSLRTLYYQLSGGTPKPTTSQPVDLLPSPYVFSEGDEVKLVRMLDGKAVEATGRIVGFRFWDTAENGETYRMRIAKVDVGGETIERDITFLTLTETTDSEGGEL